MPNLSSIASSAASGAGLGSIIPGIGTGIGAGVGALVGLFRNGGSGSSGSSATAAGSKGGALDLDALTAQVGERSKRAGARADALGGSGDDAIRIATDYFKKLASGDANAALEATAPERAMVVDQYDTARKAISEFGARGGGSNAAVASTQVQQARDLSQLTTGARKEGAAALAGIGAQQQGLALSADQIASTDLNTLISAALGREQLTQQKDAQRGQTIGGLAQGLGYLLGLYLTRGRSGGGGAGGGAPNVNTP